MGMAFAELLNQESLVLQAYGVDVIKFDEPAFGVYVSAAADWGVRTLEIAAGGLTCTKSIHSHYGNDSRINTNCKNTLGQKRRQYKAIFPALVRSGMQQVSLQC